MQKTGWWITVFLLATITAWGQTVPYTTGRIAVSSDGNMHDDDDWGASAATLAIIASQGLQGALAVYTYNDHIWGSENDDKAEMDISIGQAAVHFGFGQTAFISAVDDPTAAYHAMRDEILASSSSDPLTIIAAGPMQVVGEALSQAKAIDEVCLEHIRVISHSGWNNEHADKPILLTTKSDFEPEHTGWTWAEMESEFSGSGVLFDQIDDQNDYESKTVGFATTKASDTGGKDWDSWAFMSSYSAHSSDVNEGIQFVYSRMKTAVKRPDISDCGMTYYLFTGDDQGGPIGLKFMLDAGFVKPSTSVAVYGGTDREIQLPVSTLTLVGSVSAIATSWHWTQESGPNEATLVGADTEELFASGLVEGTYIFKFHAFDDGGGEQTDTVNVTVMTAADIWIETEG